MKYLRLLFAALFALLFFPTLVIAQDHKPQLYDYHGSPVSPLCFLNNIGTEDAPIYPSQNCQYEEILSVTESPLRDEFVSVSYEEGTYDEATEETFSWHGFVGYRALGVVDGLIAVLKIANGGGSGTFTTLMLLDPVRDEDAQTLNYVQADVLAFGDRCNGGISEAWIEDAGEPHAMLVYKRSVTMLDMLDLVGDPGRAIVENADVPYCASCCYGEVVFDQDEFREMIFTPDRMKPDEAQEQASCIENLVALNVDHGHSVFGKEDFETFVRELEHVCLGRVEGEE